MPMSNGRELVEMLCTGYEADDADGAAESEDGVSFDFSESKTLTQVR